MTAQLTDAPPTHATPAAERPRILGLRCRACGSAAPLGPSYVCGACFGPLDVAYDPMVVAASVSRTTIEAREPGIWRYREFLPVDAPPARGLRVGSTALVPADRLGLELGISRLWLKDDTRNPTLSFKDRAVAVAAAQAQAFGLPVLACASTGNLAAAVGGAAAAVGLPSLVVVPADLEAAKISHALAYGASVLPIEGTYDDVNRFCLELADETGWGFVNVNLRPFYAEGSKTLAFEVAEQLGWRTPDVIVAPIASGALFTKLARGFAELVAAGLIEARPVRFVGGQAAGCGPVATAFAEGSDEIRPVRTPDTIVHSLAIGSPADGLDALALARGSGGSIEGIDDATTATAIRRTAELEGIFTETAGGVTVAAADAARRRGVIRDGDEVVVLLTGNGLKTPEARTFGRITGRVAPGEAGLAEPIRPRLDEVLDGLVAAIERQAAAGRDAAAPATSGTAA